MWLETLEREEKKQVAAAKTADDIHAVRESFKYDIWLAEDDLASYYPEKLANKARRMHVPLPPRVKNNDEGFWTDGSLDGRVWLTPKGCAEVRKAIRAERSGRWERVGRILSIITVLGTIVAAGTGSYLAYESFKEKHAQKPAP